MNLRFALAALGAMHFCLATSAQATNVIVQQNNTLIVNGLAGVPNAIEGNGKIVTEDRTIGAITEVRIDGAFDVTVAVGPAPSLTLEGDENVLPIVKTEESGKLLRIFPDGSYSTRSPLKVRLSVPQLFRLSSSGSSTIAASGFDHESFKIDLSGSSKVALAGKVQSFAATLSGSGSLSAESLVADAVTIDISGAGKCSTTARRSVVANISGAGIITVHGNPPERSTHVSGAGQIAFMN
jgi:Putative auto-transporter adhesin, head GIN domain